MLEHLKREVHKANMEPPRRGLVTFTWGNASGMDRSAGRMVINPSERATGPEHVPAVICANHGPFTWGKNAAQAVYHAVVLEETAKMAIYTEQCSGSTGPAPQSVQDKHFLRKHGPNACYGQR